VSFPPNASAHTTTSRTIPFLTVAAVVAALYFGQDLFLPLALAVLISFLLAPLIQRLEHWRLGRVPAVIVAVFLGFSVIGAVGYTIAGQLIELANELPKYKTNLHAKIVSLKTNGDSPWNRASGTLRELSAEFTKTDPSAPAVAPATPAPNAPVPVEVVYTPGSALETLRSFAAPVVGPLGMAAVVIVLVIFMLLEREDLRDRLIHLIGRGRIHVTTQALDEAGARVSRYLVAQCIVNVSYGIPIGLGLWAIGIPNAILWGLLATILRFVPYIGAWIAALFPLALSLAVAPTWTAPVLVAALFVVLELLSNNIVEPWLYGSSTGLSAMAVIVSAIFWSWLWGAVGLLLATPLTVCIAVMGKYLPDFAFLDVLLSDRPPIAASDRFFQRLLALDGEELASLCEEYRVKHSLAQTYDEVVVPALHLLDVEARARNLDDTQWREILGLLRVILAELGEDAPAARDGSVLCLPASNESDELCALMLTQLLAEGGVKAELMSSKALAGEMVAQAVEIHPRMLCISSLPPTSVLPAQHLCKRLGEGLGEGTRLFVGLWNDSSADHARRAERCKRAHAAEVFTTLESAAREILLQVGAQPAATI
jgi:predicted PurR-regulated permease PerM